MQEIIDEQLDYLEPNKKLLEFYRHKLFQYEEDHSKLFSTLKEFQETYETQDKLEKDLQGRDEELATLRSALSDLQACLLHEREHVLRLYADNDRLKIREVEDRLKIQHLLCLCSKQFPNADLKCFTAGHIQNPTTCSRASLKRKPISKGSSNATCTSKEKCLVESIEDNATHHPLTYQVEALRAQLEDQSRLSRESISALTEDCRLLREEAKLQRHKDTGRISTLREQLKCSQDLLHRMTKDHLLYQQEHRRQEQAWFSQRDRMALKLESMRRALQQQTLQKFSFSSPSLQHSSSGLSKTHSFEAPPMTRKTSSHATSKTMIQGLENDLYQSKQQTDNFRSQCIRLEENNALLREERDATSKLYNDRCESLLKRLKLVSNRYSDLEKRFKVQMEGYRSDIKILKTQLQTLERQCLKAALRMTQEDTDVLMLQQVQKNTVQSKLIYDNLRSLKSEIYQLEQDLKHL